MTLRVSKPSFNVREKLTELAVKFGLKGSELAKAETVQDARDLVSAGRKNMVINGDMRIFQRNNAGNVPNVGTYYLDRFQSRNNTEGTLYVTQQQSNTSGPPGFRSWLLAQCDFADTSVDSGNYARIQQYIEGYNCFMDWGLAGGNTDHITASFWVKSNKIGKYCFNIEDGDALPVFCREYTIKKSDVWQKVELTFPPPPAGTWRGNDSNTGMRLTWTLMAGSGHPLTANTWNTSYGMRTTGHVNFMDNANNNFYLTGIQLEVGKNATEFEYRSYGEELALCQRYFLKTSNAFGCVYQSSGNTGNVGLGICFPVEMRIASSNSNTTLPTGTANNVHNYGDGNNSYVAGGVYAGTTRGSQIYLTGGSGKTIGTFSVLNTDAPIQFNAEL